MVDKIKHSFLEVREVESAQVIFGPLYLYKVILTPEKGADTLLTFFDGFDNTATKKLMLASSRQTLVVSMYEKPIKFSRALYFNPDTELGLLNIWYINNTRLVADLERSL